MKSFKIFSITMMLAMCAGFIACSDDDEEEIVAEETPSPTMEEEYSDNFFSIEGASFHEGNLPEATSEEEIGNVSYNDRALSGGMNFIVVNSEKAYQKFYVGIEGKEGYWEYNPNTSRSSSTIYTIPIMYGTDYNQDLVMVIIGVDENGNITVHYIFTVTHVDSESGDININLTFSTPKDVDLHLYTPSGKHIYYGERGGTTTINGEQVSYGLDHDSNPACRLDYLNNENIYIPAELVENGEYRVEVDLYSNCSRAYDCSWAVITRYKGNIIPNELSGYNNPAMGTYEANAYNGDHTTIMKFTITDADNAAKPQNISPMNFTPRGVTAAELNKIEYEAD
ncbi:MAG: hypothetical protein IJY31_02355 [Muribaculaceae bacterium]|nr:hypothetical protein [Muribaculaceae bacterium]